MEVTINKKFSIRKKRTFLAKHLRLVFLVTNMPHLVYKANALTHQSSIDIMTGSKTDLMQAKNTLPISNEATQSIYVDNDDDTVNTSPSFNNANTQPDLKRNLREVMSDNYEENIYKDKKQGGGDGNKVSRNGFEIEIAKSLFIGTLKRSVVRLCGV